MKKLIVKNILGSKYACDRERANKVSKFAIPLLKNNEKFEIDFNGIEIVICGFFEELLDNIYREKMCDRIDTNIIFSNMNKNKEEMLNEIKIYAKDYFKERN